MNRFRCTLLKLLAALLLGNLLFGAQAQAAGVTIITHGLNGDVDDWVNGMAEQIKTHYRFRGTNYSCYKVYFPSDSTSGLTWMRVRGARPTATDSGEIVIMLDWGQLASGYGFSTYDVAPAVVNALFQTNFISELGGHALAELPIHLIGHSRGGSLMSMISEILGVNGVWVDQLTTLDPHPLNNDGFIDIIYTVEDAPCRTYENVLFHDNYFQTIGGLIRGEPVSGAYIRELTYLDGGYSGVGGAHSDVHLWYHGTVDARVPASDYAANITSAERQTWWTSSENTGRNAGFFYSRIGRGDRASTMRPVSSGAQIRDGLNQRWDFGAGSVNNRSSLSTINGKWPSLIKFNLTGTNLVAFGESSHVKLFYQWAQPETSSATITFYFDDDLNPFNGNERFIRQTRPTGTGPHVHYYSDLLVGINGTNANPGYQYLGAEMHGGSRTRYIYAPERLTVVSSWQPQTLAVSRETNGTQIRVDVEGISGQRFVFQSTTNLYQWRSLSTNWLSTNRWTYTDPGTSWRFYRTVLQ